MTGGISINNRTKKLIFSFSLLYVHQYIEVLAGVLFAAYFASYYNKIKHNIASDQSTPPQQQNTIISNQIN